MTLPVGAVLVRIIFITFALSVDMGMYCVAYGCKTEKKKGTSVRFYRVPPKDTEKGRRWRAALRRDGWSPTKSYDARICEHHFIKGNYLLPILFYSYIGGYFLMNEHLPPLV